MLYFIFLNLKKKKNFVNKNFFENLTQFYINRNRAFHDVSILHLEICDFLKKFNCNFLIEKTFLGLDVDIIFLDKKNKEIGILEIHGYQHFLRNLEVVTGDSFLKYSILKDNVMFYFEIEIFNWRLLGEDMKEIFLLDLLKPMNEFLLKQNVEEDGDGN